LAVFLQRKPRPTTPPEPVEEKKRTKSGKKHRKSDERLPEKETPVVVDKMEMSEISSEESDVDASRTKIRLSSGWFKLLRCELKVSFFD
jgi:hypothetical protein